MAWHGDARSLNTGQYVAVVSLEVTAYEEFHVLVQLASSKVQVRP